MPRTMVVPVDLGWVCKPVRLGRSYGIVDNKAVPLRLHRRQAQPSVNHKKLYLWGESPPSHSRVTSAEALDVVRVYSR